MFLFFFRSLLLEKNWTFHLTFFACKKGQYDILVKTCFFVCFLCVLLFFIDFGGLKKNGLHKITNFNARSSGSGTSWEGLGGKLLLEEVCHWRWSLEFQKPKLVPMLLPLWCLWFKCRTLSYFSSTVSADVTNVPSHDENGLNFWNYEADPIKCFPL